MSPSPEDRNAWGRITSLIHAIAGDIRYGKVEITIHDAHVVQLEVTEKFRSPASASTSKQGSCPASP